ncbi:CST complex subunit CTC1 isoform X2 [Nematostella vectensis]|uniref:CST complex subunit CTC1 isoform X2 n=1 Tax=Nematostella vectensis TaxID=45351 RepID=UPI002076E8F2|nr:CST complex subunit CTC1 isoform X2 [Nematostella vectensis]
MNVFLGYVLKKYGPSKSSQETLWLSEFYKSLQVFIYDKQRTSLRCDELALEVFGRISELIPSRDAADKRSLYSSLCDYSIISLKQLSSEKEICSGQLRGDTIQVTDDCFGLKPLDFKSPLILLGFLRCPPSSCGSLCLEDNTSHLPLEVIGAKVHYINKLVILPRWAFIPSPVMGNKATNLSGYLEADVCIPVCEAPPLVYQVPWISLSTYFSQSNKKTNEINLCGKVSAISPIHSLMQSKPFFFVQLTCTESAITTSLVVQGAQHMVWHHFLHIDDVCVVTSLRETSMNKGSKNERKVLAATRHTKFINASECMERNGPKGKRERASVDRCQEEGEQSAKRQKQCDEGHKVPDSEKGVVSVPASGRTQDINARAVSPTMVCYSGVISRCVFPEAGVYELDGRIMLYIAHQPCTGFARGMRVGARVALYNFHLCKANKRVVGFGCCTLSTVRVTEFSPLVSPWKPFQPEFSPYALHGQNLSLVDYEELLQISEQLRLKFASLCRSSQLIKYTPRKQRTENLANVSVIERLLEDVNVHPTRNIYQEFLDHPHHCHPMSSRSLCLPSLLTVAELRAKADERLARVSSRSADEWSAVVANNGDLCPNTSLIGVIKSHQGFWLLYDRTGEIPVLISKPDPSFGIPGLGPHWFRDCIVKLKNFNVVTELFKDTSQVTGVHTRSYLEVQYGDIDILAQIIDEGKTKRFPLCPTRSCDRDAEITRNTRGEITCQVAGDKDSKDSCRSLANKTTCQFEKDEPATRTINGDSTSHEQTAHSLRDQVMSKVLFLVRHRENLHLRKEKNLKPFYACAVDIKIVAMATESRPSESSGSICSSSLDNNVPSASLESAGSLVYPDERPSASSEGAPSLVYPDKRPGTCSETAKSSDQSDGLYGFTVKQKSAVLLLEGESTVWHPFLSAGCFYVLEDSSQPSTIVFKPVTLSAVNVTQRMLIQTVPLRTDWMTCPSCDEVVCAMRAAIKEFDKKPLMSVYQLLSDDDDKRDAVNQQNSVAEPHLSQVSFRGRVTLREMRQSGLNRQSSRLDLPRLGAVKPSTAQSMGLGVCYLGNRNVFLRVRDLGSPNTVDVYLDLRACPYVDGVRPGAIVQFCRLLKSRSHSGNLYCSFAACSSINVEHFAPITQPCLTASPKMPIEHALTANIPHRSLHELISIQSRGSFLQTVARVRCTVTAVQKVALSWRCLRCSHVVVKNECSFGCPAAGFRFAADARCLIEDGTAEAQLLLEDDTVTSLLRLSHDELSRLQGHVMSAGDLLYQRHSYRFGAKRDPGLVTSRLAAADRLLAAHCSSILVKRHVVANCKQIQNKKATECQTSTIKVNQAELSTQVQPRLLLKGLDLIDVTPVEEIRLMLKLPR